MLSSQNSNENMNKSLAICIQHEKLSLIKLAEALSACAPPNRRQQNGYVEPKARYKSCIARHTRFIFLE